MDHLSPIEEINKFLIALAPEKLSEWGPEGVGKFVVGLLTQIEIHYDHRAKIQLHLLDELVKTCKALRVYLDGYPCSRDVQVQKNLSAIVSKLYSQFLTHYIITSSAVDKLYFDEKVSELLHELNIISSVSSAGLSCFGRAFEDIEKEKEGRRASLMEFAAPNIEEVIRTAYEWGNNGGGRNCSITLDKQAQIRIFKTLNGGDL